MNGHQSEIAMNTFPAIGANQNPQLSQLINNNPAQFMNIPQPSPPVVQPTRLNQVTNRPEPVNQNIYGQVQPVNLHQQQQGQQQPQLFNPQQPVFQQQQQVQQQVPQQQVQQQVPQQQVQQQVPQQQVQQQVPQQQVQQQVPQQIQQQYNPAYPVPMQSPAAQQSQTQQQAPSSQQQGGIQPSEAASKLMQSLMASPNTPALVDPNKIEPNVLGQLQNDQTNLSQYQKSISIPQGVNNIEAYNKIRECFTKGLSVDQTQAHVNSLVQTSEDKERARNIQSLKDTSETLSFAWGKNYQENINKIVAYVENQSGGNVETMKKTLTNVFKDPHLAKSYLNLAEVSQGKSGQQQDFMYKQLEGAFQQNFQHGQQQNQLVQQPQGVNPPNSASMLQGANREQQLEARWSYLMNDANSILNMNNNQHKDPGEVAKAYKEKEQIEMELMNIYEKKQGQSQNFIRQ